MALTLLVRSSDIAAHSTTPSLYDPDPVLFPLLSPEDPVGTAVEVPEPEPVSVEPGLAVSAEPGLVVLPGTVVVPEP